MADKSMQLLLDALKRAAADPAGLPLYAAKTSPGLFPGTTAARAIAQRCKETDLVRVVRTEAKGKTVQEVCTITEKGLTYLMEQISPRQLLEDLVRAVEARQHQLAELATTARQAQAGLDTLRAMVAKVIQRLEDPMLASGAEEWIESALAYLEQRRAAEDCPLPELFQAARQAQPSLSLGQFHDGLRKLHEEGRIYLHPWTGPLYAVPEPPCALLVGHEVAYYASPRSPVFVEQVSNLPGDLRQAGNLPHGVGESRESDA